MSYVLQIVLIHGHGEETPRTHPDLESRVEVETKITQASALPVLARKEERMLFPCKSGSKRDELTMMLHMISNFVASRLKSF